MTSVGEAVIHIHMTQHAVVCFVQIMCDVCWTQQRVADSVFCVLYHLALTSKVAVLWVVTLCCLVGWYQCLEGPAASIFKSTRRTISC